MSSVTFLRSNLLMRAISAAVLAPAFLALVWEGGIAYGSVILLCMLWAGYEWLLMTNPAGQKGVWVTVLFALALSWGLALQVGVTLALIACLAVTLVLMGAFRLFRVRKPVLVSLSVAYLGAAGLGMIALRQIEGPGFGLSLFLCATVWLTDTGAYALGKLVRGARLAPGISPGKTWAGFAGGLLAALLAGLLADAIFKPADTVRVMLTAAFLSLAAQCGDLFESWVKRQAGVKHSGELIPGHGGLLDRIDGLLMAVLLFWTALWVDGFNLAWWIE